MESTPTPISRTTWLALLAMGISVVVIANDFSAINVALPTMEQDFHTNVNTIQWVINAYALTFGVMIVTGGRLATFAAVSFVSGPSTTASARSCWRRSARPASRSRRSSSRSSAKAPATAR
jgi:MFS family permease